MRLHQLVTDKNNSKAIVFRCLFIQGCLNIRAYLVHIFNVLIVAVLFPEIYLVCPPATSKNIKTLPVKLYIPSSLQQMSCCTTGENNLHAVDTIHSVNVMSFKSSIFCILKHWEYKCNTLKRILNLRDFCYLTSWFQHQLELLLEISLVSFGTDYWCI